MPAVVVPDIALDQIADAGPCRALRTLLASVEGLLGQVRGPQEEHQWPRDENSRLNGERGRPVIRPRTPRPPPTTPPGLSGGSPSPAGRPRRRRAIIDRTGTLAVDPAVLPPDATREDREEVVVQEVVLPTPPLATAMR